MEILTVFSLSVHGKLCLPEAGTRDRMPGTGWALEADLGNVEMTNRLSYPALPPRGLL